MNSVNVEIEIDLPDGVNIRGYERHKGAHVFEVGFELPSRCTCSKCGHEADAQLRYKDEMLVVRDLDLFGQPSFWTYQAVLHQCPRCRQRTQIPTPFKRTHVTYTYRFEQYVLDQLVSASMEEVALRLGISAETVEYILDHQLTTDRVIPADLKITSLGFDELSLKKRHKLYVTIMSDLSDPEHPRVLAVEAGRDERATEACLKQLSAEQRAAVRSHRTDMSAVYPQVCAAWLPNSQSVIDRFHVAKNLGAIVDRLKKKTRSFKLALTRKEQKRFKARMWHYRRRRKDLTPAEQQELDELLDMIPELELPYCFREDVAEIFDTAKNRQEAAQRLDELRGVVEQEPELGRFFAMYDRWQNGILAYFDRHETSAAVEGLNTKARVITRRSYGLKSAHSLWSRLVLDVNRASRAARRTVTEMHALARSIQARFRAYYI